MSGAPLRLCTRPFRCNFSPGNNHLAMAIASLQKHQGSIFGALCCERLLPAYEEFARETGWQGSGLLRRAIDLVWQASLSQEPSESELEDLLLRCEACVPDSEDFTSLYTGLAQNAATAICSLIDYMLGGRLDDLLLVPRLAVESIDLLVQELSDMNPLDPTREVRIQSHALMRQELTRQARDVEAVRSVELHDSASVEALRKRAKAESILQEL